MIELKGCLTELESKIVYQSQLESSISSASVGWHIEHSLLVINGILGELIKSNPEEYKWKFNTYRLIIFTRNKIPRGKGRAPVSVQPTTDFDTENVSLLISKIKEKMNQIALLTRNHHFVHPIFGDLNIKPAKKFIRMHTKHHLDIIVDILK